jgi:hypothetical protein
MFNKNYISECKQLLQAFELTQANMLNKKYELAREEFLIEINQMSILFTQMKSELNSGTIAEEKQKLLLMKQIVRLIKYIEEFGTQVDKLNEPDQVSEEEILFIFERQYKFKVIYKKHLADFVSLV